MIRDDFICHSFLSLSRSPATFNYDRPFDSDGIPSSSSSSSLLSFSLPLSLFSSYFLFSPTTSHFPQRKEWYSRTGETSVPGYCHPHYLPLVLLSYVVFFGQVHQVNDWLGCDEQMLIQDLNLPSNAIPEPSEETTGREIEEKREEERKREREQSKKYNTRQLCEYLSELGACKWPPLPFLFSFPSFTSFLSYFSLSLSLFHPFALVRFLTSCAFHSWNRMCRFSSESKLRILSKVSCACPCSRM